MTTAVNTIQIKPQILEADQKSDTKKFNKKLEKAEQALSALKNMPQAEPNSRLSQLIVELVDMLSTFSKGKIPKLPKNKVKTREAVLDQTKASQTTNLNKNTSNQVAADATNTKTAEVSAATVNKEENFYTALSVKENANGTQSVYTEDGYIVSTEGKEQAWNMKSPDGKITRIWGDPHVVESDGDKWDFKDQSSFLFGKNKVTIQTVPAGDGQTYTSKITVYSGDSRATISGIDKDKPLFEILKQDATLDDAIREDGDIFVITKETKGDDKFVLIKDVAEQFDPKFASKVGVGEKVVFDKLLTAEQKQLLGRL